MKALIGVSAVLIAAMNLPCAASQRADLDEPKQSLPAPVRVAQTAGVDLPALRVAGAAGNPIALNLKTPTSGVRFVKISDFPEDLQLSRGFRLRGSWITSVQDLENVELITPPGLVKTFKLDVQYFRSNQTPPVAQRVLMVELEAQGPVVRDVPHPAPPQNATTSTEREVESLERGAILMRNGDIAGARLLYEDLAVNGSAKGARALAETYDPAYLKGVFTAGLRPNMEKAKIWYQRAAELGDTVSITRLSALDGH